MTRIRGLRLGAVMGLARWLGVPIDVHPSFLAFGKKDLRTSACSTAPK